MAFSLLTKVTTAARENLTSALETATISYDDVGRVRVINLDGQPPSPAPHGTVLQPATPGSADADAEMRLSALLDEREELKRIADAQMMQLHSQLAHRLEVAEEQREAAEGRARVATEREHATEQRLLEAEVSLSDSEATRRALSMELHELRAAADEQERGPPACEAACKQQAAAASMSAESAARDRAPGRERGRSVVYNRKPERAYI